MVNVYRIVGSVYVEEDQFHNEFTTVVVGTDIKRVTTAYLDKFPKAEILEIQRINYVGEEVFNVI